MAIFKYLLALLFSLVQFSLSGQESAYYIHFKSDGFIDFEEHIITCIWSDGTESEYSNSDDFSQITDYYNKRIEHVKIEKIYEIDLSNPTKNTKQLEQDHQYSYFVGDNYSLTLRFNGNTTWSFDLFQDSVKLYADLVSYEDYFCAGDTLKFVVDKLLSNLYTPPIKISLVQDGKSVYYGTSDSSSFLITYEQICELIVPQNQFDVEVEINNNRGGKTKVATRIKQVLPYVKVGTNDLYVVDSCLSYPTMPDTQKMILHNTFGGLYDTISGNKYNLSKYFGLYELKISQHNHCPVKKLFVYPEVIYHYVKDSAVNFWYSGESRNAVDLKCYYMPDQNTDFYVDYSNSTVVINSCDSILVQQDNNAKKEDIVKCNSKTYHLNCTDSLTQVNILVSTNFIPVTKNIKLKSYPKISVSEIRLYEPLCYYDSVKIKVKNVSGGFDSVYKFILSKNNKNFISEDDSLIVPGIFFDGDTQNIILTVCDNDYSDEDFGFDIRKFSTDTINFHLPDTIKITEFLKQDLKCHNDLSGKIEIKSFEPKNKNYTFHIYNDTFYVNSFKADDLSGGKYLLKLSDENKCESDTISVVLNDPNPLKINNLHIENLKCYDSDNGSISFDVSGGTPGYSFLWSNGERKQQLKNVSAGEYSLKIKDSNNCEFYLDTVIFQPEKLTTNLSGNYRICKNSSITFDANDFARYLWLDEKGLVLSENRFLELDSAGVFTITVFDSSNCYVTDTLNITMSEEEFEKSFLVSSESFLGDTVVLINDTKYKDRIFSFILPEELENLGVSDSFYNYIVASIPGTYTLVLNIEGKDCIANQYREIKILDYPRPENYDSLTLANAAMFVSVKFGPNPNRGNFFVDIVLTQKDEVDFYLFSMTETKFIDKLNFSGSSTYSLNYTKPLKDGFYFVMLKTKTENKVIKFMVSN